MKNSQYMKDARVCLSEASARPLSQERRHTLTMKLAALLLQEARRIETFHEKKRRLLLAKMMADPKSMRFTVSLADQCFRCRDPKRATEQIAYLMQKEGIPSFLPWMKQMQLKAFPILCTIAPRFVLNWTKKMIRQEAEPMIKSEEKNIFLDHLRLRRCERVKVNLNHVGEAILGEHEAEKRLEIYLNDLENPEIECISIKISSLFSQTNLLAWDETLAILEDRLKKIYRMAKRHRYVSLDGTKTYKLVTLDMEEYRDLHLTAELFMHALDTPEFCDLTAGIVLQSYLPDSYLIQQQLTDWAMQRVKNGGAPIHLRLVKGANLAMEKVEASIRGWNQAPYLSKAETDANFLCMLHYACQPRHSPAVHLGIGSHNLFDIAYALILRAENHQKNSISFEMLEGMADSLRRVVHSLSESMLLYCPVSSEANFQNAFAYLVRRLDENSAPENFLRALFNLTFGSKEWMKLSNLFTQAMTDACVLTHTPRRQHRQLQQKTQGAPFENEPDTDFSLIQNRFWIQEILDTWRQKQWGILPFWPEYADKRDPTQLEEGVDPSRPNTALFFYPKIENAQLEPLFKNALVGYKTWSSKSANTRCHLLYQVAQLLSHDRGELIAAMVSNTAKTVLEADTEVSEAIDFLIYYSHQVEQLTTLEDIQFSAKGIVAVLSPWNFPCSIPTSGIAAALAAGNSVIFKPAPEAVLVGWLLVNIFWKAGVEIDALQFFPCPDEPTGTLLIQDSRLASIILTGATSTAKHLMKLRPEIDLMAETGGKNALIVTNMADRDLAVRDIVQSAFSYSGQKCSACSLAILEKEVYEDLNFRKQLHDAAKSLRCGSAWQASTRVNPLIRAPAPELYKALTQLDEGEEWLLKPTPHTEFPNRWSPGIKIGIRKGSFFHQTELFGPVLGVMCAQNLEEAIQLANSTPYGLTTGLHTLDEREQKLWEEQIIAGNCYINRTITGAIVRRQPFGGCKESSFGKGAKAGGPNYILQLMRTSQKGLPKQKADRPKDAWMSALLPPAWDAAQAALWKASLGSYLYHWTHHFSKKHDPSHILGQNNFFYYKSHPNLLLRVQPQDQSIDYLRAIAAIFISEATLAISLSKEQYASLSAANMDHLPQKSAQKVCFIIETEEEFKQRIEKDSVNRVRWLSPAPKETATLLANRGITSFVAPVLANGRLEHLNNVREVCLSIDTHRYGYLTDAEAKSPPMK